MSQYLFCNVDNLASGLTATSFLTSSQFEQIDRTATGGGLIELTGNFNGADDALYEFEILSDTINGVPVISTPVFVGIGNGTIGGMSATAAAQDYTVTLVDLGTPTEYARTQFRGVTLVSAAPGAAGNLITLSVDHSDLVFTASAYSLPDDVIAGNAEWTGERWNFGAPTMVNGLIPADAPRLKIGDDPTIYRHYKKFDDNSGQYTYHMEPAIAEDAAAGTLIKTVTGSRTVTVTNGTTTNTHTSIVTIYDLLSAIQSSSTLLTIDGTVSNDRAPGGHGIRELNTRTASYVRRIDLDGTDYLTGLNALTVATTAPTETVRVTCVSALVPGAERWSNVGNVSGTLAQATTGVAYTSDTLNYTIPIASPVTQPPEGVIKVAADWQNRATDEVPVLCDAKVSAILGAAAQNMTAVYTYQARPTGDCDCDAITLSGFAREDCLGIEPPENVMATLTAPFLARLETLTEAKKNRIKASTKPTLASTTGDKTDLLLIGTSYAIAGSSLVSLSAGDLDADAWVTATEYDVDDVVEPTTADGYRYRATVGGTSGGGEPTWPAEGATVADGGVTWLNIGKKPLGQWDDEFAAMDATLAALLDSVIQADLTYQNDDATARANTLVWSATKTFSAGEAGGAYALPTTRNGHLYYALVADTDQTGGSEPTWPTNGGSVVDNAVIWYDLGTYWEPTTAHTVGQYRYIPEMSATIKCVVAGDTDSTEPTWPVNPPAGHQFTDDGVTWEVVDSSAYALADSTVAVEAADRFAERYRAAFSDVLMTAGIAPNFDEAGLAGSLCWQDTGADHWWVPNNNSLPAFTNVGYHEAYRDADGNVIPTKRFFFYPAIACEENLEEGDTLTVTIDGVGAVYQTYQVGDQIKVSVVHANPLGLTGGQDGDDTLTWRVVGTVDGVLTDYALDLDTLPSYSDASGLDFAITPGTIDFALNDSFSFSTEGGEFQWRRDGGTWSSSTDIADTVALDLGVTANFVKGAAPSFVDGDTYSIRAVSANGPANAENPDNEWMEWSGSTTITGFTRGIPVSGVFLAHEIPSTATVQFQGSDNSFSTTPLDVTIPWAEGQMAETFNEATYAEYRLVITSTGTNRLRWVCAKLPWSPNLEGQFIARYGTAYEGAGRNNDGVFLANADGGQWSFEGGDWLGGTEAGVLRNLIRSAFANDRGRVGFHIDSGDSFFVRIENPEHEFKDVHKYQPTDASKRIVSVSMDMRGVV